ncbi:MAG: hypothetical protein HOE11_04355 [Candidatus Diapherotrites archaeon]|nr:hypothetical protein [Candidatus Diapherotrites archaeon]MBT4596478.1 hypothetical protein [Candidatus Diapherotrites archaeon]
MEKGQIFSLDFILAVVLLILFLGTIINAANIQQYNSKAELLDEEFTSSIETAAITLLNGNYSCEYANTKLASSIDLTLLTPASATALKSYLGLEDKLIFLEIDGTTILDETAGSEQIYVFDFEVLTCNAPLDLSQIILCTSTCDLKKTMSFGVGR